MRYLAVVLIVVAAFLAVAQADETQIDREHKAGTSVAYKNVRIFPIYRISKVKTANYLTLDQALREGLAVITEVSDSGTVRTVIIENKSNRPIFIMAGEVIIGGKQDRVIARDTIIPPKSKMGVDVFCVERGRWAAGRGGSKFDSSKALAHNALRRKAQDKEGGGQQEVWREVAKKSKEQNAQSDTGTYKKVVESKEVQDKIKTYVDVFLKAFEGDDEIVGFVMCVNEEVLCCDIFLSKELCKKLRKKIIQSYVVEALGHGQKAAGETATAKDVKDFITEAGKAKSKVEKEDATQANKRLESDKIIGFESEEKKDGKSRTLHRNIYKKK